ncbi:MAG: hypothetical protein F6K23_08825 [Okeania sp. SIO2C9]|uniref:hypothetical protein n=1 Tax=Okeania sp. SIO2C9 TaxID=2607791 RepID=UPI0013C125ED|nr:hypothetical protein [Okeania sp. SIO2C9]NEQ73168.1 hypothetical protein [Okeania sp. SIO2C9]
MKENIAELKSEVETLQAEIETLQTEVDTLRHQRSSFRIDVSFPPDNTPETLAEFHKKNAEEAAKWQEELQEINQSLKILEAQLNQKKITLAPKKSRLEWHELQEQVYQGGKELQEQVKKVNEKANELEAEIQNLKQIYQQLNPLYCEWVQNAANIVDFKAKTIPYVYVKKNGFELGNKEIDSLMDNG